MHPDASKDSLNHNYESHGGSGRGACGRPQSRGHKESNTAGWRMHTHTAKQTLTAATTSGGPPPRALPHSEFRLQEKGINSNRIFNYIQKYGHTVPCSWELIFRMITWVPEVLIISEMDINDYLPLLIKKNGLIQFKMYSRKSRHRRTVITKYIFIYTI